MWEIRGIITMCFSVYKNQTWEGMAQTPEVSVRNKIQKKHIPFKEIFVCTHRYAYVYEYIPISGKT